MVEEGFEMTISMVEVLDSISPGMMNSWVPMLILWISRFLTKAFLRSSTVSTALEIAYPRPRTVTGDLPELKTVRHATT